jgi:hypothetical protein
MAEEYGCVNWRKPGRMARQNWQDSILMLNWVNPPRVRARLLEKGSVMEPMPTNWIQTEKQVLHTSKIK